MLRPSTSGRVEGLEQNGLGVGGALSRTEGTRHVCLSPFTREPDRGFVLSVAGRVLTGPL